MTAVPYLDRITNDIEMRRWLPIRKDMPDDEVAACIAPFIPVEIVRDKSGRAFVIYYSESYDVSEFRRRIDEWEADFELKEWIQKRVVREAEWTEKLRSMDLTEPDPGDFWRSWGL